MTRRGAERPPGPETGVRACDPDSRVPPTWAHLAFFRNPGKETWADLSAKLSADPREILPTGGQVFAALEACPPEDTRVVILGQDPYPTPGHAHGFAFSVAPNVQPLPRSLQNIFKEMRADLGACPPTGDLRFWAAQGVLLLNAALSVPAGNAGGHMKIGWHRLLEEVLESLNDRPRAFVLWGAFAQKQGRFVQMPHHLRIETAHPSPLSARRGFFGSRPFSRVNDWLRERGEPVIDWTGQGPQN